MAEVLVLLGMILLGLFGSQLLGALLAMYVIGGDVYALQRLLTEPEAFGDTARYVLLGIQGMATVGTFILPPVFVVWAVRRQSLWSFSPRTIVDSLELFWTIALIPVLAPLLELTITWNKNVKLPGALHGIELWAQAKEAQLADLTEYLIAFSSFGQFAMGLLVVAVLPAIGEELLFRGMLQPLFQRLTGSPHRAIWITAIIFSAIHVQFYGFVPRMLLGALFGYLYYWSGNISIPILAHFVNNGITVVLSYLARTGQSELNPDKMPEAPLYVLVMSAICGGLLLYRFRALYFERFQPKVRA